MDHSIALNFEDGVPRFIECRPDETIADASFRLGINIPLDCRDGVCGTCKCLVESGEYELVWTLIAPLNADGSLDRLIAAATNKARARGDRVAARLRTPSGLSIDPALRAATRSAVEPFAGDVIAKMVVICALLRAATGPQAVA